MIDKGYFRGNNTLEDTLRCITQGLTSVYFNSSHLQSLHHGIPTQEAIAKFPLEDCGETFSYQTHGHSRNIA